MSETYSIICTALVELRAASRAIQKNLCESTLRTLRGKYDIMFLGEKANTIYDAELRHALNVRWGLDVEKAELLAALPSACALLGISCEEVIDVKNAGKKDAPIGGYRIELF